MSNTMSTMDLTPGEALVLLEPNRKQGPEMLKLSLMWLLAQKHIAAATRRTWRFGTTHTHLEPANSAAPAPTRDLAAVLRMVHNSGDGRLDRVLQTARTTYEPGLDGMRKREVLPGLERRGLVRSAEERFLLFFRRMRWHRTASGEYMRQQLEKLFEDARRIPDFLDRSPAQAAALAVSLGGLILLLPELRPHLGAIAQAMRPQDGSGSGDGGSTSSGGSSSSPPGSSSSERVEHTGLDSAPGFDFAALDSIDLDTITTTLDAFDSAASDGGGDGGGGDGGGGGGD